MTEVRVGRGYPASPLESFLFLQVGSGDGRNPFVPVLGRVKVSAAATGSAAWRRRLSTCRRQGADLSGAAIGPHGYKGIRRSAKPPRHDQHGPAPMGRDGVTSPSRMPTSSTTWATSTLGRPSSTRSSRVLTMLFGRLEAPGAPRWADWAVGERRWAERGVSGCAASGPTHFAASYSWERVPVHVCVLAACWCHSFCDSYRPPRAVAGQTRSRAF